MNRLPRNNSTFQQSRLNVAGLIAAAGKSTRMGQPKALIKIGGQSFIERLICSYLLSGISPIVVSIPAPPRSKDFDAIVKKYPVQVCSNPWPELGISGSIQSCLKLIGNLVLSALVVCPVDMPFASPELISKMISIFCKNRPNTQVIVPTFHGVHGHPVLFSQELFHDLLKKHPNGPRDVIATHHAKILELDWYDKKILANINEKSDLKKIIKT